MATFGVKLEDFKTARDYIIKMNKNLSSTNMVRNPFKGSVVEIGKDNDFFTIISLTPFYPNPIYFVLLTAVPFFVFHVSIIWYLIPLVMGIASFMHTKYFFFLMFKIGLRKNGYAGKVKMLQTKHLIAELLKWHNEKY